MKIPENADGNCWQRQGKGLPGAGLGFDFEIKVIEGTLHDMSTFQELNGDNWDWPNVYWKWRVQPYTFIDSITQFLNKK